MESSVDRLRVALSGVELASCPALEQLAQDEPDAYALSELSEQGASGAPEPQLILLETRATPTEHLVARYTKLRRSHPDTPVLLLCPQGQLDALRRALRGGSRDLLATEQLSPALLKRCFAHALVRQGLEQDLRESRQNFSGVVEYNLNANLIVDDQDIVRYANPAAARFFGKTCVGLVGAPFPLELTHRKHVEIDYTDHEGTRRFGDMYATQTVWSGHHARLVTVHDVTARTMAQQALERSERRFRTIFAYAPIGVVMTDHRGVIHFSNAKFQSMLGCSEEQLTDLSLFTLTSSEDAGACRSMYEELVTGERDMFVVSQRYGRAQDNPIWARLQAVAVRDDDGGFRNAIAMIADITESKRAEEALRETRAQLRQSQTMDAIGQLAGEVAHDFNNMLAIIVGYTDVLLEATQRDDPLRSRFESIRKAADRSADLTQQLLTFSRKQILQAQLLDLNDLVASTRDLLCLLIGEDIDLRFQLSAGLGQIKVDPQMLQQVLMNIAVNARDALPQGGELLIETAELELDASQAPRLGLSKPGRYLSLTITDNGVGIEPEIRARIFEPFFTTKEPNKGTGLGLSTAYGIVTQSLGSIQVTSRPGEGASFEILLPRASEATGSRGAERPSPHPRLILLFDPDSELRELIREILEAKSFDVIEAGDPESAERLALDRHAEIGAVIMNQKLNGGSSRALQTRLLEIAPGLSYVIMSNSPLDGAAAQACGYRAIHLEQPFSVDSLCRAVRAALKLAPPSMAQRELDG
jgi:two-component system, cell cycle sensor histidine kinase and response regulator CckA